MTTESAQAQRATIQRLFRRLELPSDRTCLMHQRHFRAARLAVPEPDLRVDAVLRGLSADEASALIDALVRDIEEIA